MKFNKDEVLRVAKTIRANIKNGKGLPNNVTYRGKAVNLMGGLLLDGVL